MSKLLNVSSSPHVRSKLTTQNIMIKVILALVPVTALGIWNYKMGAVSVLLASVLSAVITEAVFNIITKKKQTVGDGSAALTGLLLALVLPPELPIYIPILGGIFAILIVKCLFGGLGKNFMNPALAARCFLLISYGSIVTVYKLDGVATATPLVDLAAGESVNLMSLFMGSASGVIGSSVLGILIGAALLFYWEIITFEIPAAMIVAFTLFMAIFGGVGFDIHALLVHIMGGGVLLGAFFMATDYVTSPVASTGQLVYGAVIGILCGLFRVFGSAADSVSYAIIIGNILVPLIEEHTIPVAYGYRKVKEKSEEKGFAIPKPAITLCCITLVAGLCLSAVYALTKDAIAEQQALKEAQSYKAVCAEAEEFVFDDALTAKVDALEGGIYGDGAYGKAYINKVAVGNNAAGEIVGYVVGVTSGDGFDGDIVMSVGLDLNGVVTGIEFTDLSETAGMGMLVTESAFKDQFVGDDVDSFVLNKAGGSTEPNQIDSVSGSSISSGAVVNAVNAARDFFAANVK